MSIPVFLKFPKKSKNFSSAEEKSLKTQKLKKLKASIKRKEKYNRRNTIGEIKWGEVQYITPFPFPFPLPLPLPMTTPHLPILTASFLQNILAEPKFFSNVSPQNFEIAITAAMSIAIAIVSIQWNNLFRNQQKITNKLLEREDVVSIIRNVLWALECTKLAYPSPLLNAKEHVEVNGINFQAPPEILESNRYMERYRQAFQKYNREVESLSLECNEFCSRWILFNGDNPISVNDPLSPITIPIPIPIPASTATTTPQTNEGNKHEGDADRVKMLPHSQRIQLCRDGALAIISNMKETIDHHERLNNLFVLTLQAINPEMTFIPTLSITVKDNIRSAENYIELRGKGDTK
jgi:hypothetical protein